MKRYSRFISLLLSVLIIVSAVPVMYVSAAVESTGTVGANVTWSLDSAGVLTLSGSGAMQNYDSLSNPSPFKGSTEIKKVRGGTEGI